MHTHFYLRIIAGAFEILEFIIVQVPLFGLVCFCLFVRMLMLVYIWPLGCCVST
jgi:hypothetical protein